MWESGWKCRGRSVFVKNGGFVAPEEEKLGVPTKR